MHLGMVDILKPFTGLRFIGSISTK